MNESNAAARKPLAVYAIIDRKEKSHWLKVGAAFTNRDGSLTLILDAVPLATNRLQVREPRAWDEGRAAGTNGHLASAPDAEVRS